MPAELHPLRPARRAHDRFLVPLLDAPLGRAVWHPRLLRWGLAGGLGLGAVFAVAGWAASTGLLLLSVLTPWAAAGAVAGTFAAAGVGVAAGSLAGALAALMRLPRATGGTAARRGPPPGTSPPHGPRRVGP